jgi:hypothetical protein
MNREGYRETTGLVVVVESREQRRWHDLTRLAGTWRYRITRINARLNQRFFLPSLDLFYGPVRI